jgi:hypothetical protein
MENQMSAAIMDGETQNLAVSLLKHTKSSSSRPKLMQYDDRVLGEWNKLCQRKWF